VWLQKGATDKALADYNRAIELDPKYVDARYARGWTLRETGAPAKAIEDFSRALERKPDHVLALLERGRCNYQLGRSGQAADDLTKALELNPQFAAAAYYRGLAHQSAGEYAKAIEDFARTIRLAPDMPAAFNDLAWLLAACPEEKHRDGATALKSALKACQLADEPSWRFLDTLAVAYAATGDFAKAVETQKQALAAAEEAQLREREELQSRLELFEAQKPYHDPPPEKAKSPSREF
jgi:tetratricopeptide (TPR) repeat protein